MRAQNCNWATMATRMPKRNDTIGLARRNSRAARIVVYFLEVFLQNNNTKIKQTKKFEFSATTRTYKGTSLISICTSKLFAGIEYFVDVDNINKKENLEILKSVHLYFEETFSRRSLQFGVCLKSLQGALHDETAVIQKRR